MEKKTKKGISLSIIIVGILIIILGIVLGLIFVNNLENDSNDSEVIEEENKLLQTHTTDDMEINNLTITEESGVYIVNFEFTNNSENAKESLNIGIRLYDKDGNYIFTLPIYIENIEANSTTSIEYSLEIDISDSYDYEFLETEPEGI